MLMSTLIDIPSPHSVSFKLFFAFTLYYLVERLLRYLVSNHLHSSEFRAALHSSRKDLVYFGILLGALITLTSFPFCANAFWQNPSGPRNSPMSLSAEVCITSRAVLWISELNRLDLYPQYVYHHIGCVVMLLSVLHLQILDVLYLPLATLITEIPGDIVWILSAHRELDARFKEEKFGRIKHGIQVANIWAYVLARIPSIPAMMYTVVLSARENQERWGHTGSALFIAWGSFILSLYSAWVGVYLHRQYLSIMGGKGGRTAESSIPVGIPKGAGRTGNLQGSALRSSEMKLIDHSAEDTDEASAVFPSLDGSAFIAEKPPASPARAAKDHQFTYSLQNPVHIRFSNGVTVTLYGPLMGAALSSLALVSFLLAPPSSPLSNLSISLLLIIALAVLGARLVSLVFEDTVAVFFQDPVKVFLRPGFWVHGGLAGAALGLLLSKWLGIVHDLEHLTACLCIALPLYEAISRIGCETYGCCYGRPTKLCDSSSSPGASRLALKVFAPIVYTTTSAAAVRLSPSLQNVPLFPIQRISSILFFLQFVCVCTLIIRLEPASLTGLGAVSLVCHSMVRMYSEKFRGDFRGQVKEFNTAAVSFGLSTTGRFAALQMMIGLLLASRPLFWDSYPSTQLYNPMRRELLTTIISDPWSGGCLLAVFLTGTCVYGIHKNAIGRGVTG